MTSAKFIWTEKLENNSLPNKISSGEDPGNTLLKGVTTEAFGAGQKPWLFF